MAKYLTKEQVVADFKLNYLPHLTEESYNKAWELMLDMMLEDDKISEKQRNIWKYPK